MLVCATVLVRGIRRAVAATRAPSPSGRPFRAWLFYSILGIVIGAWFFTFGALSLLLGV